MVINIDRNKQTPLKTFTLDTLSYVLTKCLTSLGITKLFLKETYVETLHTKAKS